MEEAVARRLKERLEEIVFIELKKDIAIPGKKAVLRKNIPMPIPVKKLSDRVSSGDYENLSVKEMVEGMALLVAADPAFEHNPYYTSLMKGIDENMDRVITGSAIELAENNRLEDAFAFFET
ncbi:MAG: hypothetical protein C0604_01395, partial [Clostridiales bacterium]